MNEEKQENQEGQLIRGANGLLYKTETILRHKNRLSEMRDRKARQKLDSIKIQKAKKKAPKSELKRPEDFVANYRNKQKSFASVKSRRKHDVSKLNVSKNELVVVLRIVGDAKISEPQKRAFNRLRLKKQHEAAIFRADDSLLKNLRDVENRVIFGTINRKILNALINKRGFLRVNKELKPINSNKVVEDALGDKGIICVEDIVATLSAKNSGKVNEDSKNNEKSNENSDHFTFLQRMLW